MSVPVGRLPTNAAVDGGAEVHVASGLTWPNWYAARVNRSDLSIVVAAVISGQLIRFGTDLSRPIGAIECPAIVVSVLLILAWCAALRVAQASDPRVLGSGANEYARVLRACFGLFGAWAIVDLVLNLSVARGFVAIILPLGTTALLASRWLWRRRIVHGRARGRFLRPMVVVGSVASAAPLINRLTKNPALGYRVVGLCVPVNDARPHRDAIAEHIGRHGIDAKVPVMVGLGEAANAIAEYGANTVALTSTEILGHAAMRELSWQLEGKNVDMLVAPGLLDVAGPRITVRPEAGLPLLHVDKPRYQGATKLLKTTFDKVAATLLIVMLAPVMVACAIAIKLDSRGPIFYRAERMGVNNEPFLMWKFRSMVQNADTLRAGLADQNDGNAVLFKMRDDPRVTRVGRFLRRYSLDELPQLFNVIDGSMSLVGPRPPLRDEVESYDATVVRRMLVRPGMTGLWQVSGRSDLTWEDSVQLDLSYVENWSLAADLVILWRTARAVISSNGAY
jgi:exopolysaccharide biosynthesis polyprenyl glycosylphosphotransferase